MAEADALPEGGVLSADVVVTATGLNLLPLDGITLTVDGIGVAFCRLLTYQGMMFSRVPNFAFTVGHTNVTWTVAADLVASYACRLLTTCARTGTRAWRRFPPDDAARWEREPIIDLQAAHFLRSAAELPKQGSRASWRLIQN